MLFPMALRSGFCATSSAPRLPRSGILFRTDLRFASSLPQRFACGPLPFTRDMGVHGLCGRVPDSAGNVSSWIASAQTDANLSTHLHRLPTPPPYLRQMRLPPGRGRSSCKSPRIRIPLSPPLEHKNADFVRGFNVRFYYLV